MQGPQSHMLDPQRLHLHHGPIDLIVQAWGRDWQAALEQAEVRFQTVLDELVKELAQLRLPLAGNQFSGNVANRMADAVAPFDQFVTPMAAVAGSVADEVCQAMTAGLEIDKAYVNNGGDIAVYLKGGHEIAALIPTFGQVTLSADQSPRGLASSGWQGRSHSMGIADTVTVLANDAAAADVAATLISNAVDLPGHKSISRQPANELQPDSDLGSRLVTVEVGILTCDETVQALAAGQRIAKEMLTQGLIAAAALFLNDQHCVVGSFPMIQKTD
ncbi:MAG: ApbE superfamily uncharacterized protein (UPF0280 family) [Paracoccaceae bacterium]|jgi:ApbE superfamily uncharacterized protein (UPF0280 family)